MGRPLLLLLRADEAAAALPAGGTGAGLEVDACFLAEELGFLTFFLEGDDSPPPLEGLSFEGLRFLILGCDGLVFGFFFFLAASSFASLVCPPSSRGVCCFALGELGVSMM